MWRPKPYAADFIPQMKISVVLPKLAMSKINVKKADMSLMCLCIMPWLAFTADWGTSSRNHTFHKGYICGWFYSWYCDLQHADRSVQQESHDSRSIGTCLKNAWCWFHTRCNRFWFLDLGYGHSHMWEAAVAILLLDMEKTQCKPPQRAHSMYWLMSTNGLANVSKQKFGFPDQIC
jgi:hypothetical protein